MFRLGTRENAPKVARITLGNSNLTVKETEVTLTFELRTQNSEFEIEIELETEP